ncbi:unnamed protein product [Cochlearia groenlandica]
MSLINDHSNEANYISKPNSSEDHSSQENCGLEGGANSASSSSTMNSDHQQHDHNQGFMFNYPSNETIEDHHNSLMDFNTSSLFNFDHHHHHNQNFTPPTTNSGAFSVLDGNLSYGHTSWSHHTLDTMSPRFIKTPNFFETTSNFGLTSNSTSKPDLNHGSGDWLYSDSRHEIASPKPAGNKRPCAGEIIQASKKPCKAKPKATTSPKDPQSLAAKNRRERISERLKVLQELVPNGTKVDLVTMLEKAIGYVKFLQLQVKVLAADEFWPAQGGKAPDISQVKEAIDAILSSTQRDRNSN